MTYRLLLWFDMLEEEGKSTERVRGLFSRTPLLSKDLNKGNGNGYGNGNGSGFGVNTGSGYGDGFGNTVNGDGFGNGKTRHINDFEDGNGYGRGWVKIMAVKI